MILFIQNLGDICNFEGENNVDENDNDGDDDDNDIDDRSIPPSSPLSDNLLLKVDRLLRDPAFETHFFSVSQLCNKILCSCFMLCYVIIFKNLSASSKAKAQIPPHSSLSLALAVFQMLSLDGI